MSTDTIIHDVAEVSLIKLAERATHGLSDNFKNAIDNLIVTTTQLIQWNRVGIIDRKTNSGLRPRPSGRGLKLRTALKGGVSN
jgi:hypothetical protein